MHSPRTQNETAHAALPPLSGRESSSGDAVVDADGEPPILIVEDDPDLRVLFRRHLHEHGFTCEAVGSAEEAYDWLARNQARLLLLDYGLPGLNGGKLVERLRQDGFDTPFVVVTGEGNEQIAVEMMKQGAEDYWIKTASLIEALPRLLERTLEQVARDQRLRRTESELRRSEEQLRRTHAILQERVRQQTRELANANADLRAKIEQRQRADEELRRREAELARVARMSTMGEMLAELAHELNQPLGAISSYAQACKRLMRGDLESVRGDLAESVSQVVIQADRAAEIIRGLRRLMRDANPSTDRVSVNELVREAARLLEVEAATAGVQMCFELSEPAAMVEVDRIQIEQVLVNLIRNAIEALGEVDHARRRVMVRVDRQPGSTVQFSVEDNGPGLTTEQLQRVFDRFYSTKPSGMGMGLSISRSIVENHGGWLWAECRPRGGTGFYFNLKEMREERQRDQ